MTTTLTRTDRQRFDAYSRSFTTAFDLDDTRTTNDKGEVTTHRFEVSTNHWKDHKAYRSTINRMTYTIEPSGTTSTMLRNMVAGEPSPVPPVTTPTARFNKAAMRDHHNATVQALLNAPDALEAVIAWTRRETEQDA